MLLECMSVRHTNNKDTRKVRRAWHNKIVSFAEQDHQTKRSNGEIFVLGQWEVATCADPPHPHTHTHTHTPKSSTHSACSLQDGLCYGILVVKDYLLNCAKRRHWDKARRSILLSSALLSHTDDAPATGLCGWRNHSNLCGCTR
eukprot:3027666-Amphidinium_carterae.1